MYKILLCFIVTIFVVEAKIKIAVSIEPQAFFVEKIGGDLVETYVLVPATKNPENYEPLLSQMKFLKDSVYYFGIGMEFENKWRERFLSANPKMKFINLALESTDEKIVRIKQDSHIWLSMNFAKKQARKIYEILLQKDPGNQEIYEKNFLMFLEELKELDLKIKAIFSKKGVQKNFLVFHPAFEFFAIEYGLVEWAIENHNKKAKIKHLQEIHTMIRQKNLKVIYIQPQFSKKQVQLLADQYHLTISILDPFARQWDKNLLEMAQKISSEQ